MINIVFVEVDTCKNNRPISILLDNERKQIGGKRGGGEGGGERKGWRGRERKISKGDHTEKTVIIKTINPYLNLFGSFLIHRVHDLTQISAPWLLIDSLVDNCIHMKSQSCSN